MRALMIHLHWYPSPSFKVILEHPKELDQAQQQNKKGLDNPAVAPRFSVLPILIHRTFQQKTSLQTSTKGIISFIHLFFLEIYRLLARQSEVQTWQIDARVRKHLEIVLCWDAALGGPELLWNKQACLYDNSGTVLNSRWTLWSNGLKWIMWHTSFGCTGWMGAKSTPAGGLMSSGVARPGGGMHTNGGPNPKGATLWSRMTPPGGLMSWGALHSMELVSPTPENSVC